MNADGSERCLSSRIGGRIWKRDHNSAAFAEPSAMPTAQAEPLTESVAGLPGRVQVLARVLGESRHPGPVGVHHVDLVVAVAAADKGDLLAVGRPRGEKSSHAARNGPPDRRARCGLLRGRPEGAANRIRDRYQAG